MAEKLYAFDMNDYFVELNSSEKMKEETKMGTLGQEAQAYEPPQTLNIAEVEKVPLDIKLEEATGKDNEGQEFKYKYAEIDGKKYRVPGSVIGGIKALLGKMPNLKYVSVIKQGQGMNTRYQVIPVTE